VRPSFTKFKDRIWGGFDASLRALARSPGWVRTIAYGGLQGVFLLAYLLPGSPLAPTARDFAKLLGRKDPFTLHRRFSQQFACGLRRMEMLRNGEGDRLESLLQIPDADVIDQALAGGRGAVLVMPHCHASIAMVRGLGARYPVLMLVRESSKGARAEKQRSYYDHLGCPCVDVRRTPDGTVAREVLKALRGGKLVVGVVDRIQNAPPAQIGYDKERDSVRVTAFGQPVGWPGWPARFADRAGSPILPAMVTQSKDAMVLRLGTPLSSGPLEPTTRKIATALEALIRSAPEEWVFLYDKHWRRVLRAAAQLPVSPQPIDVDVR